MSKKGVVRSITLMPGEWAKIDKMIEESDILNSRSAVIKHLLKNEDDVERYKRIIDRILDSGVTVINEPTQVTIPAKETITEEGLNGVIDELDDLPD